MGLNSIIKNVTGRGTGGTGRAAGGRRASRGTNTAGQAGRTRGGGITGKLKGLLNRR